MQAKRAQTEDGYKEFWNVQVLVLAGIYFRGADRCSSVKTASSRTEKEATVAGDFEAATLH